MKTLKDAADAHLLLFMDALGFWQETRESDVTKVDLFFEIVERQKTLAPDPDLKVKTVGDSVIAVANVPGQIDENKNLYALDYSAFVSKLQNVIEFAGKAQAEFAKNDIWVRGAITYGKLRFNDWQIIGPAFDEAYRLEAHIAKYPRVILDGRILTAARKNKINELGIRDLYNFNDKPDSLITITQDVPTFVDYVRSTFHSDNSFDDFMNHASTNIKGRLLGRVEHFQKHWWTANYLRQWYEKKYGPANMNEERHFEIWSRLEGL